MPLTDQHRFGMQLAQMSRGWRAELDRRLAGLGLSQARWLVLLHLARFDEAPTQRELAQSVGVEGPTLWALMKKNSASACGFTSAFWITWKKTDPCTFSLVGAVRTSAPGSDTAPFGHHR